MNDPSAHQAGPDAVHDGTGEASVFRMGHQARQLLEPLSLRGLWIDFTQLRKNPSCRRHLSRRLVATGQLERFVRKDRGQVVSFLQGPSVDEAIVAARALHVKTEEDLGYILGELHVNGLSGAYVPPPLDPVDKPGRILVRVDQLPGHLVVRLVASQSCVEPGRDLLAPTRDESGPGVVVAQKIVPKSQPMIGISDVVG